MANSVKKIDTIITSPSSLKEELSHFYGTEYDGFAYSSAPITEVFEDLLRKFSREGKESQLSGCEMLLEEETLDEEVGDGTFFQKTRFWKAGTETGEIFVEWVNARNDRERILGVRSLSGEDLILAMQAARIMEELGVTRLYFITLAKIQEFNTYKESIPWASGWAKVLGFGPHVEYIGIKTDKLYILSEDVRYTTSLTGQYDIRNVMLYMPEEFAPLDIIAALEDFKKEHRCEAQ